jgi:hypothetical protein
MILVPTRELALQTAQVCKELGKHTGVQVMVTTGGTSLKEDIMRLTQEIHMVVATPGRILDLSNKGVCILNNCRVLVMDEVSSRGSSRAARGPAGPSMGRRRQLSSRFAGDSGTPRWSPIAAAPAMCSRHKHACKLLLVACQCNSSRCLLAVHLRPGRNHQPSQLLPCPHAMLHDMTIALRCGC